MENRGKDFFFKSDCHNIFIYLLFIFYLFIIYYLFIFYLFFIYFSFIFYLFFIYFLFIFYLFFNTKTTILL